MRNESARLLRFSLILGMVVLAGCGPAVPAGSPATPQVTVAAAIALETIDYNDYTGTVKASETVEIRARVDGYLEDILFDDGDFVEKDKELFKIEPDEYQAIYDQSVSKIAIIDSKLELAEAKHARNISLLKSKAVSQEEFDETAAMVKVQKSELVAAKADAARTALDLKYTTVTAPISGRIDRAIVTRGNFVTRGATGGTLLTTIVKEDPAFVYFDVDEAALISYRNYRRQKRDGDARPGSLANFEIPCYVALVSDKEYPHVGLLDFASNQSDAGTGTITIRGTFENKDLILTSGLYVRVRVPVSDPYQAVMIPEDAIALDQSQRYVYVVGSDGIAKRRDVELGSRRGSWRIVKKNLEAGEKVVIKGLQRVRPDKPVDAAEAKDLQPPKNELLAKPPPSEETEKPADSPTKPEESTEPKITPGETVPVDPAPAVPAAPATESTEAK